MKMCRRQHKMSLMLFSSMGLVYNRLKNRKRKDTIMPIDIQKDLAVVPLPPIYQRKGHDCYLDPFRKKLIRITPEETIRQKVIKYFCSILKIPEKMVSLEVPLSEYQIKSKDRADIIIHRIDKERDLEIPLAVVECKADTITLTDNCIEQGFRYADQLLCDYVIITNGIEVLCYKYSSKNKEYLELGELPTYGEMLEGEYLLADEIEEISRTPFNEVFSEEVIDEYTDWCIGIDTPKQLAPFIINLWECLLDINKKFPKIKYKDFEIIEDNGVRILSYGNAGGGNFAGPYRSLLIKDIKGDHQIISFAISKYSRSEKRANGDDWPEKTVLVVAIDDEKKMHHSLQLVLDDNIEFTENIFKVFHNGRITIGNNGAGKVKELKDLIQQKNASLLNESRIYLGSIKNDHILYMNDKEVILLIERLISYALIRDEYRDIKQQ